jgi:hypothetical protein
VVPAHFLPAVFDNIIIYQMSGTHLTLDIIIQKEENVKLKFRPPREVYIDLTPIYK